MYYVNKIYYENVTVPVPEVIRVTLNPPEDVVEGEDTPERFIV
jgi:hypothetical protein